MALRLSIANQKGGVVGKTTTAVNLAAVLAALGGRVLRLDYDPQGHASHFLGVVEELEQPGLFTSAELTLATSAGAPMRTSLSGVDLLPDNDRLAQVERQQLENVFANARRLASALRQLEAHYDAIIADCAPSLGMLTTCIHASDSAGRAAGKGSPLLALDPSRREPVEYGLIASELLDRLTAGGDASLRSSNTSTTTSKEMIS